ncbi:MAG: restriction endonuclease subunit S [Candidatus Marinimicrobia bacterium]|nr:restriction endonuclease subunit S [Candidatus Neomarinimicrobiota bacterium]
MPALTFGHLKKVDIKYPPLAEQERIVAKLDQCFDAIDNAKANVERNLQNAKELFQSKLNQIFSEKGDGWVERKLGDEKLLKIIDGDRGKNYPKKVDFLNEGFCVFSNTGNVRPDGFNFDKVVFITEERDNLLRKGKLKRNDVVMTTRGTIGNLGLYNSNVPYDHIRINSGMLIFRPNKNEILPEYLFSVLRSSIMKEQIKLKTTGAAQPQLPIMTLVSFIIPVPVGLDIQMRCVKQINKLSTQTKTLESNYQQELDVLDELKKSILQKAFNGELV